MCVSKHVCIIYHQNFVFSPLTMLVLTCSPIWWDHRGGQSHNGVLFSPSAGESWKIGITCWLQSSWQSQKAEKKVQAITLIGLGRGSHLVTGSGRGGCGFIHPQSLLLVCPDWNYCWLSLHSSGSLSSINAPKTLHFLQPAVVKHVWLILMLMLHLCLIWKIQRKFYSVVEMLT